MASNLVVSEHGGCALLQVAAFQDGILTVLFLDGEHRLLPFLFPHQRLLGGCLFPGDCLIVAEQVKLISGRGVSQVTFGEDVIGGNIDSSDGKLGI